MNVIEKQQKYSPKRIKSFWKKVEVTEDEDCWEWNAGTQTKGYGSFGIAPGKTALAHRVAYELRNGNIPDGMCVMHDCDNRKCCNPAHLKVGSIADNNRDMINKNRHAFGERAGNSKLKDQDVINMRSDFWDGKESIEELTERYEVCTTTVRTVVKGKSWKHLPLAE